MKKILIQGILFHPFTDRKPIRLHEKINPAHHSGWWLREKDIDLLNATDRFIEMKKPLWLTAARGEEIDREQLVNTLKVNNRPTLVSRGYMKEKEWVERDKGFVVANDW